MEAFAESPTDFSRQVSGQNPAGEPILSVLTKRTYTTQNGAIRLAEEQWPLIIEPEPDPELPDYLDQDTDLFPYKLATDVVVKGRAYGRGQRQFLATVRIGDCAKSILVMGDRECRLRVDGSIAISEPAPVEVVPLRYTHAYGGRDGFTEAKYGNVVERLMEGTVPPGDPDLSLASPYVYPRNSCGRGYIVESDPEAVEALTLPNLEDPDDVLGPERLLVGHALDWLVMPMPQATDWLCYGWFPRIAYLGMTPAYRSMSWVAPEIARGLVRSDLLEEKPPDTDMAFRMTQGASLGLQVPYLQGGEPLYLERIHPEHDVWTFRLPEERPRLWVDGREGHLSETEPVIHTVVIEPDENRLSVVWRGAARARRPYMDEELEEMPFRVVW